MSRLEASGKGFSGRLKIATVHTPAVDLHLVSDLWGVGGRAQAALPSPILVIFFRHAENELSHWPLFS